MPRLWSGHFLVFRHKKSQESLVTNKGRGYTQPYGKGEPLKSNGFVRRLAAKLRNEHLIDQVTQISDALETTADLAQREGLRAESAEQSQQMFFAAMVHQLKTPLQVISGNADNLLSYYERMTEEKRVKVIHDIIVGVSQMNDLINDNLAVVKEISEGWQSEAVWIDDCEKLIENLVDDLKPAHPELRYISSSDYIGLVKVDRRVVATILQALIENASTHGLPQLPVLVSVYPSGYNVCIAVTNWSSPNNDPISEDVFSLGCKGKESMGTGLGLWIARNYAHSLSGEITVRQRRDDRGQRTTFTLSLQQQQKPNNVAAMTTSQEEIARGSRPRA